VSLKSLLEAVPEGDRVLLDTTILAAFFDAGDATHSVARHVVNEMVATARNSAVVSMITVMEILIRPLRASPTGHRTVLAFLRSHPNMTCVPVDLQVAREAAHLRADENFKPPDALIVGTGLAAGVGHLVTNDRNWKGVLAGMSQRIEVVRTSDHLPFP
jgi:predicted nucleic acid-binding protein